MRFDIGKVLRLVTLIVRAEQIVTAKGQTKKTTVLEGVKVGKAGMELARPELADKIDQFIELAVEIAQARDPHAPAPGADGHP